MVYMKIGVALSGCDIGGLSAFSVLDALEKKGYELSLVSSCCMPTVTAMMRACGFSRENIYVQAQEFLETSVSESIGEAANNAAGLFTPEMLMNCKNLAVSSVNLPDGKIITFTNAFKLDTEKLRTFPLERASEAFNSTISLMDGQDSYHYLDCRLCDYSVWYGCPVYPLKMSGISKTVSISFLPEFPKTPYEALVRQITAQSPKKADVHVPLEFTSGHESLEYYIDSAIKQIEKFINKIYWRTLF